MGPLSRRSPGPPRVPAGLHRGAWRSLGLGARGLTQDVVGHDDTVLRDPGVETWVTGHRTAWLTSVMRVVTFKSLEHRRDGLKSAFIQIMPLTWDSFLLP